MKLNINQLASNAVLGTKRILTATSMGAIIATGALLTEADAETIGVKLYIDSIHAIETTNTNFPTVGNEDRDELWGRVIGRGPNGQPIDNRFPATNDPDDYLEFWQGTIRSATRPGGQSNKNNHRVHFPEIWEGHMNPGEHAHFLVTIQEQDNSTLDQVKEITKFIFKGCEKGAAAASEFVPEAEAVKKGCQFAAEAADLIPASDDDEMIGAVQITLGYSDILQPTFLAANGDAIGGAASTSRILNTSHGAMGLTFVDGAIADNKVSVEMVDNEGEGKYVVTFRVEQIEPAEVVNGYRKLWNSDVERGTCRGGRPVSVRLPDGSYRPIEVGETILIKGDGNRHIEYMCGGSVEVERNLFDRIYDEFAVERTEDKLNYYGYQYTSYTSTSGVARAVAALRVAPEFDLKPVQGSKELFVTGLNAGDLTYCQKVMSQSYEGWPIKPMFSWWSAERNDMFTTDQESWYGCEGTRTHANLYGFNRLEGLVFAADKPQPAGTVPLYRFWKHNALDNLTSTSLNFAQLPKEVTEGYGPGRLVGYILPPTATPRGDLKMLNTWYFPKTGDFLTSSKKAWQGKVGDKRKGGTLVRNEGRVMRGPK